MIYLVVRSVLTGDNVLSSGTKARRMLRLLTGCGDRARAPWCLDRVCRRRLTWCVLFAIVMSHMNAAHSISAYHSVCDIAKYCDMAPTMISLLKGNAVYP